MLKTTRVFSISLVLVLLISAFAALPALAAKEVSVKLYKESFATITNVVAENPAIPMYIANAPVTVTFHGNNLSLESIEFFSQGQLEGSLIRLSGSEGKVKFDLKKFVDIGETEVRDELVVEPIFLPLYVTGNYATLTKPGYYVVQGAPEAVAPSPFVIQVVAAGSGDQAGSTVEPGSIAALPTASKVLVNGKDVSFEAYNINGSNYFKLRDLAMVVSGTQKQFEVSWDGEKRAINLLTGKGYTPVGGEFAAPARGEAQTALPTASRIYVNGQEVQLTAYQIGGNNYFKLRDIARVMNFRVTWDAATSTIGIDTGADYTE